MTAPAWMKFAPLILTLGVLGGCGAGASPGPSPMASASSTSTRSAPTTGKATGPAVSGTYTIGDPSTASYTAHETFLKQNSPFTPVGKTSAVTGTLVLASGRFQPSTVTVDLRPLKTDSAMRDRRVQTTLNTAGDPHAVFAVAGEQAGSGIVTAGATANVELTGSLTIHGIKRPAVWDVKASLLGNTLHLTGSTSLQMTDFAIKPPNVAGFVTVKDGIELSVDLTAKSA